MRGVIAVVVAAALLSASVAAADEDAKTVFEHGTALFALHRFGEAAVLFEKAFELRPDPVLLYNAAQAHRLAGNKTRALELYESLLRLYPDAKRARSEIQMHITELRAAIDAEHRAASSPPVTMQTPARPPPGKPAKPANQAPPPPAAPTTAAPATPSVVLTAPPPPKEPVTKKRWFLPVVIGAAVVVVAGVVVGVAVGTEKTVPPKATFGTISGN
jgi:tetratricopeptide (TPR) repeat protein